MPEVNLAVCVNAWNHENHAGSSSSSEHKSTDAEYDDPLVFFYYLGEVYASM